MGNPLRGKFIIIASAVIYLTYLTLIMASNIAIGNRIFPFIFRSIVAIILFYLLYKGNKKAEFAMKVIFILTTVMSISVSIFIFTEGTFSFFKGITFLYAIYVTLFTWFLLFSKDYMAYKEERAKFY